MNEQELLEKLARGVTEGNTSSVESTAKQAIEAGLDPLKAIQEGLSKGIKGIGEDFENGTLFLTELMISAEAMTAGMKILLPEIKKRGQDAKRAFTAKVILGTVAGDIHSIGKTLVGAMLTAYNFEVVDLGEDVPVQTFVDKVREVEPNIIGLSALLTTTMVKQREVIEELTRAGLRERVKVMVGGAPVEDGWAKEIRADAYGADALDAVEKAKRLIGRT